MNQDGIFKIANIGRGPNESASDKNILDDVELSHSEYVSNGALTSRSASAVVHAPICMPDVNRNVPVPRRMMLRQADFNEHGLTAGCFGCQWLTHKVGNSSKHTEDRRKIIEEAIGKSEEEFVRMQKQKDLISIAVDQIVADGDHQYVAKGSIAN